MKDEIPVRKIDTTDYLEMVRGLLEEQRDVPLRIAGWSMSPFLVDGRDWILIHRVDVPLRRGDMAFYQRDNGQYVMHRIRFVRPGDAEGEEKYYFIGDAQRETEGPIRRDQIFGLITAARRKEKWLHPGDFWWEFFRVVWLRVIPIRRMILRLYTPFHKLRTCFLVHRDR